MDRVRINSFSQLQRSVSSILEAVNADRVFALAAASNPLIALEELGYQIESAARPEIADRIRFGAEVAATRRDLRAAMANNAGHSFDPDNDAALRQVLFDELKIRRSRPQAERAPTGASDEQRSGSSVATKPDEFEQYRGAHPIIEPLLEYRKLGATVPQFAPVEVYEAIRSGRRSLSVRQVTARLKAPG